jgi:O-antigen ligase/Flp pilus assembly protein TadD
MRRASARRFGRLLPQGDPTDFLGSRLRLLGVGLLCAKVALVPLVFHPSLDVPFTVPKVLLSHALAYLLAGVIAGLLIRFGSAVVVRSWLHAPVLAFLGANVVATALAADQRLGLFGTHVRMLGLGTIADYVVLYFAVVLLIRTRREVIGVVSFTLGVSLLVLAYEAIQLLDKDPLGWTINVRLRPISTIGQPTSLAQYLTMLSVSTLALAVLIRGLSRVARGLAFAYSVVLLAGAGATATRSAVLGLAAACAVLIALVWIQHPSRWAHAMSVVGAGLAAIALAVLLLLTPLGSRVIATLEVPVGAEESEGTNSQLLPSSDPRAAIYSMAAQMVQERPLFGYGPDNFSAGIPKYRADDAPSEIRQSLATSPHSWIAQVATSSGLLGLASFCAIVVLGALLTLRAGYRPLASTGLVLLAAFLGTGLTTINDVVGDELFWLGTAMIAVGTAAPKAMSAVGGPAVRSAGGGKPRKMMRPSQFQRLASVICVALGLSLALTATRALEASHAMRSAQIARLQGRQEAITLALKPTQLDPGRAEYWDGLGLAYISKKLPHEAAVAFARASQLAPYDARYFADLASALVLLERTGDTAARGRAIEAADAGARIDPNNPQANLTRAVVRQAMGDLPEAMRSVERALMLDPQSDNAALYVTAAQIYLDSGRPAEAERIARQGLETLKASRTVDVTDLRIELARALAANAQPVEALAELDLALSVRPGDLRAQRLRAEIAAGIAK